MSNTCRLTMDRVAQSFATSFYGDDGRETTRYALLGKTVPRVKVVARVGFADLHDFYERCQAFFLGKERKWVKVIAEGVTPSSWQEKLVVGCFKILRFLQTFQWSSEPAILLNISSLMKRTSLSRKEILTKTPQELSSILAQPEKNVWEYGRLDNQLFPHVFCINTEHGTDQVGGFNAHLNRISSGDLNYTSINAVNGKDPSLELLVPKMELSDRVKAENRDDRASSHLRALKEARNLGLSEVLILEDSARFLPPYFTTDYVRRAKKELPKDWGVLFLGHYDAEKKNIKAYSDHLVKPGLPYDMHAYLVNASMYDPLIDALEKESKKAQMRSSGRMIGEDFAQTGKLFACKENVVVRSNSTGAAVHQNYRKEGARFAHLLKDKWEITHTRDGLPIMPPLVAGALYQMMWHMVQIFQTYGVKFVVESGSAIGAARHKGLIPHDDDIDICILPGEAEKLKNPQIIQAFKDVGLELVEQWVGARIYPTNVHPNGAELDEFGGKFRSPYVDLFFWEDTTIDGKAAIRYKTPKAREIMPDTYILKEELYQDGSTVLGESDFGPVSKVPTIHNPKPYLAREYGADWLYEIWCSHYHLQGFSRVKPRPVLLTDRAPIPYVPWNHIKGFVE